jgi:HAD superfamily hydrolase (TIGR01509 family)
VIPAFPVYLFDVDGTLVDSAEDICGALREALANTPQAGVEDAFLRRYIGRHLICLLDDLFPGISRPRVDDWIAEYRSLYLARGHRETKVYPGVREALAALGGRKSTATTKGTPTTRAVLEQFGLIAHFDHVQGTDGFPAKPEPDVIHTSLAALGARPDQCLMVGDSPADMEAGRRAGVKICAVRYGYGDASELARWQPDYWVDDLRELASCAVLPK